MGAEWFEEKVEGASCAEAFRYAQEDARYEYGHGGYTGTIAEADGFKIVTEQMIHEIIIQKEEEATEICEELDGMIEDETSFDKMHYDAQDQWRHNLLAEIRVLQETEPTTLKASIIIEHYESIGEPEKWGPAYAVPCEGNVWWFFGTASS